MRVFYVTVIELVGVHVHPMTLLYLCATMTSCKFRNLTKVTEKIMKFREHQHQYQYHQYQSIAFVFLLSISSFRRDIFWTVRKLCRCFHSQLLLSRRKFTSVKSTMNRTEQYSLNIPDKKEFYNSRPLWLSHSVNHAISCESCHLNTSKQFRYISNWTMTN